MDLQQAANRVHLGRSIAFFGAGFSREATNLLDQGMLPGSGLSAYLCEKLGEGELPLSLSSQLYVRQGIQPDLQSVMKQFFTAKDISNEQAHLSCLPWRRIYTTNYDNIIESARVRSGQGFSSATVLEKPSEHSGRFTIVHLHGFVERLSRTDWDQAYVLTDQQYASDHLRDSGWLETFRADINYADAIFFFGYSMSDLDVARLLYENPSLSEKTFFVVGRSVTRETEIRVEGYGNVIKKDVSDVAAIFPLASDGAAAKAVPFLSSLYEIDNPPADTSPSREVIASYLLKGDLRPEYIARDLAIGTHEYFISRDVVNQRADALGARPERVILHSNLGEGKTSALLEVNHYLRTAGWNVYWFNGVLEGFEYDIDFLSTLESDQQSRTAIIVENCFTYSGVIRDLTERYPLVSIFSTTRTAALQTRIGNISDAFGEDYELVDISRLSDDEIADLDDILYSTGLWAERQGDTTERRQTYIKRDARSDLATVLADACRSSEIFRRFRDEVSSISQHPVAIRRSLIITLFSAYAGIHPTLTQICEIVEADLFKMGRYQADPVLAEFIDFSAGRVTVRSPTFAKAVLKEAVSDASLIDDLPSMVNRLHRLSAENRLYGEILKATMRFGVIEGVLSDRDKEQKLVAYYEAIRAAGIGLGNPQFWLQYAIACMSFKDYQSADQHFKAAFGLAAHKGGYDPYQIENQYARFLIESRTQSTVWGDAYDAFKEANEIITRQMSNFAEGAYPYRVARNYLSFVEANNSVLNPDQKARIAGWCGDLMKAANNAPDDIKISYYWRQAQERLSQTIDYLRS